MHDDLDGMSTDVAVVGGGVVGMCVAHEFARRGHEVVVLEKDVFCAGTSTGNAGFVVPSHVISVVSPGMFVQAVKALGSGRGPVTVRPNLNAASVRWLARFLRHCNNRSVRALAPALASLAELSAGLYRRLLPNEGIDCAYEPNGLLKVACGAREFAKIRREAGSEARFGVCNRVLGGDEVRHLEPALCAEVAGGVFYPNDAGLDPGRFVTGLAAALARRGVVLASNARVAAVQGRSGVVESLATSRGTIRAKEVVLAAGMWIPQVAALFGANALVLPAKGYSLTVRRPRVGPRRRLLLGEHMVAVAPMGERLRLSGWFELGRRDGRVPQDRLAQLERSVRSCVQMDAALAVEQRWTGFRPVTPDGAPIIGRVPGWRNVTFAAGHAMLGMTLAPATGRLVAQLVDGEQTDVDATPFSPRRFQ